MATLLRGNTSRDVPAGRYAMVLTLGRGNNSIVKLARHIDTGYIFAIKVLNKRWIIGSGRNRNHKIRYDQELSRMTRIRHANVVTMYEIAHTKTRILLITGHVTGGKLFDRLPSNGRFSEAEARKYFQQLIFAVNHCYIRGVSHRNLKPENLLLDADRNLKVTDFGLSTLMLRQVLHDGLLGSTCGLPQYMPPEVICNLEYDAIKTDIWSCGVILFRLLSGYLPFNENNTMDIILVEAIKSDVNFPSYFSPSAKRLIERMLDPFPATRITIEEIIEDEWFKDNQNANIDFDDPPNPVPEGQNAWPAVPVTRNVFDSIHSFLWSIVETANKVLRGTIYKAARYCKKESLNAETDGASTSTAT